MSEIFVIRPDYSPPTTLSEDLNRRLSEAPRSATHILVLDRDVELFDDDWIMLPIRYPEMDIIGFNVVPSSKLFRVWESLTFWIRLHPRLRDCAVIYRKSFLERMGGFPSIATPGTWLADKTDWKTVSPVRVIHDQSFNLAHSVTIQLRDGRARAQLHKSFWVALGHSIVRFRPLVILGYVKERAFG